MKYPKSANEVKTNGSESLPAYVSWDSEDESEVTQAFATYADALDTASHSVATVQRDFQGLTPYADGRLGDRDWETQLT